MGNGKPKVNDIKRQSNIDAQIKLKLVRRGGNVFVELNRTLNPTSYY